MKIEELKKSIESNTFNLPLIVMVCKDETSEFIFHQYLHQYIINNDLSFNVVDSIDESEYLSLFNSIDKHLNIYYTEKLEKIVIPSSNQLWIRCKSINKDLQKDFDKYIIIVDKIEKWQIKDYVYSICNKVNHHELDYLLNVYGKNLYRIENEIQKISIFENQDNIYPIIKPQLYTDESEFTVFDLANSLLKHDIATISKILKDIDNIDIDVFGLLKILLTNFKRVIDIQLSKNPSAQSLGITDKQFWAIKKYSCGIYTRNQLLEIYLFLTECDFYIKSGYIDVSMLLNYIVLKILCIKEKTI